MDSGFLSKTILFQGTKPTEVEAMLHCLEARRRKYKKGQYIFCSGDRIKAVGVVLSGSVNIENDDLWGNKTIWGHVGTGEIFAESYACTPEEPMLVSVVADEDTEVMYLDVHRILTTCSSACAHHQKIIQNLLFLLARKNQNLSRRILHTSSKSIRGRVVAYLSDQIVGTESNEVEIPFNRQQMADYLNVDRSALSGELSKMQRDEIIKVKKNKFTLLKQSIE